MLRFPLFEGDAGNGGSGGGAATPTPTPTAAAGGDTVTTPTPTPTPSGLGDTFTGIPEKFAADPDFQNFKGLEDVFGEFKILKSLDAQRKQNGLMEAIGENSTPEQVQAFWEKLGKPKSAAEYELARPEDLPQGMDYSDELAAKFAEFAHEKHLTKAQAQECFGFYHDMAKDAYSQMEAAETSAIADNFQALESKWGAQDSESFRKFHGQALKAFNFVADREMADAFKADPKLASNPLVLDLLARLGAKMGNDVAPTVTGTLPTGGFPDTASGIQKQIDAFKSDGRFAKMMKGSSPEAAQLKKEWQGLWDKMREAGGAA